MNNDPNGVALYMPLAAAATGAFLGALFALWVSQINERIKGNRERWKKHRNALVYLEHMLNEIMATITDNRHWAETATNSAVNTDKPFTILWGQPQKLPRCSEFLVLTSFLRQEIKNHLFSYDQKIRKYNHDIHTLYEAYAEMRGAFLRGNIDSRQYQKSLGEYRDKMKFLLRAHDLMDDLTKNLSARTRITLRQDQRHDKSRYFRMPELAEIAEKDIIAELPVLAAEITEVRAKSRAENDKYLGKTGDEKP
jgi:hypothetical protein